MLCSFCCLFAFCSYFIKLLLDKKYALPYRVLDAVTAHFMRFQDDERVMPVIWHQSLLTFVQRLDSLTKLCGFYLMMYLMPDGLTIFSLQFLNDNFLTWK